MASPSAVISVPDKESLQNLMLWAKPGQVIDVRQQRLYLRHFVAAWADPLDRALFSTSWALAPSSECGTATTAEIEAALILLWKNRIRIQDAVLVRDYLLRYPDMIDLVVSVCETASERFGAKTQLSLEVYCDPEIEDQYLTLYVRQEYYDDNVLKTIEGVRALYAQNLAERSGWLLLTTDFGPPR